jgi:DNA repair ATPase RecN
LIKQIIIKSFECHKDLIIDFNKNLTLLTGYTRSGKSSIIRALQWVMNGIPSGDIIVPHGTNYANVTIILDNNTSVTRERKNKHNKYIVDGVKYEAFGNSVPLEIKELFNDSILNTQTQVDNDKHFLILDSDYERVKIVNKITGADQIDRALINVNKIKQHTKKHYEFICDNAEKLKKDLQKYKGLTKLKRDLKKLIKQQQELDKQKTKLKKLEQLKIIYKSIEKFKKLKSIENEIDLILLQYEKIEEKKDNYKKLADLKKYFHNNRLKRKELSKKIDELIHKLKKDFPSICPLCNTDINKENLDEITLNL